MGQVCEGLVGSSYPQIVMVFPTVDNHVDNEHPSGPVVRREGYFHCVETPNPPAMNAKPMTMFQLPMASIGQAALVT
ncbi:hypothetical protein ABH925_005364 [Streptacidiphilus sp. EB129]